MSRTVVLALTLALTLTAGACVAPPPPPQAPPAETSAWKVDMRGAINAERTAVGQPPLTPCAALDRAADAHSADQAAHDTMGHTGSDGSDPGTRIVRAGYTGFSAWGENVAAGQGSVAAVMAAWMGSPGHRANLLDGTFQHVGVGLAYSAGGTPYWTQAFGRDGTC